MENTESTTEFTDNAAPVEAPETDALAESDAEDAAINAAQAAYFTPDGNLQNAPGALVSEPEPVTLSAMLGAGDAFVLAGRVCRLSALSLLETDAAQAVLSRQHPLLYAAVLTDPPKGGDLSKMDAKAIADAAALITGREDYSEAEARDGLRKLTLRLPIEQQKDFAAIVLASLRKRTPEVSDADVLGALSLGELIGATRQVFAISGGLADFFTTG